MTIPEELEYHSAMPAGMRYTFQPRLWPHSLLAFTTPFLLFVTAAMFITDGQLLHPVEVLPLGAALIASALALGLLRLRRSPAFGIDDRGVWLRLWPPDRGVVLVPWPQVENIDLSPQSFYARGRTDGPVGKGVYIQVRYPGGTVPRRPWFIPCDVSDYDELVSKLMVGDHRLTERRGIEQAKAYFTRVKLTIGTGLTTLLLFAWLLTVLG